MHWKESNVYHTQRRIILCPSKVRRGISFGHGGSVIAAINLPIYKLHITFMSWIFSEFKRRNRAKLYIYLVNYNCHTNQILVNSSEHLLKVITPYLIGSWLSSHIINNPVNNVNKRDHSLQSNTNKSVALVFCLFTQLWFSPSLTKVHSFTQQSGLQLLTPL